MENGEQIKDGGVRPPVELLGSGRRTPGIISVRTPQAPSAYLFVALHNDSCTGPFHCKDTITRYKHKALSNV